MKDLIVKINTEGTDAMMLTGVAEGSDGVAGSASRRMSYNGDGDDDEDLALIQPSSGGAEIRTETNATDTSSGSFWPDLEVLDPDHPILERFQANLTRLLEEEDEQLTLKISELEEQQKHVLKERKKLSSGLEDLKRSSEKSQATLKKEKECLDAERAQRRAAEARVPDDKLRVEAVQAELDRATASGLQLEKQLDVVRKKLADMKRKTEEQQEQLNVARGQLDQGTRHRESSQAYKLFQDVMINQLLSDTEGAEWRRTQSEALLLEEEQLIGELRDAIRNANAEVAAINAEKIRLNQSWQSSLLALQRDHDALTATRQSIKNEESRRDEIIRCWTIGEKELSELSSKRAGIQLELGRIERKVASQETQFEEREIQKGFHDQRNRNIQTLLRMRQEELQTFTKEAEQLVKNESDALDRIQAQRNKRQKLEAAILDQVYSNHACDQEGQSIYKHIRQTEEISQQLDLQIATAESRNGRLMLEQENLERDGQLQAKLLEEKEATVKEKENKTEKLDLELIEMQKLLERKETVLLRYKTSLEELKTTLQENEGHRTEEERILKGLQMQLDECRRATEATQRRWSDAEQHLINVAMARDQQAVQEEKLREEVNIWETKKKRLLSRVEELKTSQAQCQRSVHGWREHLQLLDTKLAKTLASKENLERWNQLSQRQWHLELEEPERQVYRMREEGERLRLQQSSLEITLCDLSKVAMLWQCKLADIREAQNYVQAERSDAGALAILQAEKHRLEVQEVQLKKEQEVLNYQLQKMVSSRSALNVKADLKVGPGHRTRVVQQPVDANAWHKILSKEIAHRQKEVRFIEKTITKKKAEAAELAEQRNALQASLAEEQRKMDALNRQILDLTSAKKLTVADLVVQQKWWRFWDGLKRGTYRRKYGTEATLSELEARARQKMSSLITVANQLAKEYPKLAMELKDISNSLQSAL